MSPDPTQVAGYRVIRRIGRGGMSTVYLAEHLHLQRRVALKVLDPEFASTPTFRTRFARECQIVAELEHPHIVPIYDAGEADGLLFLVMRFVEQGDLRDVLASGDPLHHDRLRVLVDQLAGALGVAHDAGLVHRDIKPANVLSATGTRGGDHFYLSDFGITKRATSGPPLTATGQVLGSVDFIAPEQIAGRPLDRRTDVYAFGGLVYQCLTGHLPFERDHELAVLLAHVREDPLPPSTHRPDLAPEVDAVLARVLSKDPDARPATARDFADELVAALAAKPRPVPRPTPTAIVSPRPGPTPVDPTASGSADPGRVTAAVPATEQYLASADGTPADGGPATEATAPAVAAVTDPAGPGPAEPGPAEPDRAEPDRTEPDPVDEEPAAVEPTAEVPAVKVPAVGGPAVGGPAVKVPAVGGPAVGGPAVDEPPTVEEPAAPTDPADDEAATRRMPVPARPAAPGPVTTFTPPPTDAPPATGNPRPTAPVPARPNERRWIVVLAVLAVLLIVATVVVALAGART